jgi:hypothetical protein
MRGRSFYRQALGQADPSLQYVMTGRAAGLARQTQQYRDWLAKQTQQQQGPSTGMVLGGIGAALALAYWYKHRKAKKSEPERKKEEKKAEKKAAPKSEVSRVGRRREMAHRYGRSPSQYRMSMSESGFIGRPDDHVFVPFPVSERSKAIMRKHYPGLRSGDNRCARCGYGKGDHPTATQLKKLRT